MLNRKQQQTSLSSSILGIIGFLIFGFCLSLFGLVLSNSVSATPLTYQKDVPVSFTFDKTISVSVSSDLHIYNLVPGTYADSNIITISTATNNPTGYVLYGSVGSEEELEMINDPEEAPYFCQHLFRHGEEYPDYFAGLDPSEDLETIEDIPDDSWGYSVSNDGETWSSYSGLPCFDSSETFTVGSVNEAEGVITIIDPYTGEEVERTADSYYVDPDTGEITVTLKTWKELSSRDTNGTQDIRFKIGAKASGDQESGEYSNVINFRAVTNYTPMTIYDLTYMQDFVDLEFADFEDVKDSMIEGEYYTLKDIRDNKAYYISKLEDDRIWMTQNLDFEVDEEGYCTYGDEGQDWDCYSGNAIIDPGEVYAESCAPAEEKDPRCHVGNYYQFTLGWVCPDGWVLPEEEEVAILLDSGGSSSNPLRLILGGYYDINPGITVPRWHLWNKNKTGTYWISSSNSDYANYSMGVMSYIYGSTSTRPYHGWESLGVESTDDDSYDARPIRCILNFR